MLTKETAETTYDIHLIGKVSEFQFQKLYTAVKYLCDTWPARFKATVKPLFATQYEMELKNIIRDKGSSFFQHRPRNPLLWADTSENMTLYFATPQKFIEWAARRFRYYDPTLDVLYWHKARFQLKQMMAASKRDYVQLQLKVGDEPLSPVVIELFSETAPKTCANFIELIAAGRYSKCPFHRIVKGGWIQTGDVVDGSGGNSVSHLGAPVEDETFSFKHDAPGIVGMANQGRDSNGSQFYITTNSLPFLDGVCVAFGRVVSGMRAIWLASRARTHNERPLHDSEVRIEHAEMLFSGLPTGVDEDEQN